MNSRSAILNTMIAAATLVGVGCNPDDDKVFSGGAAEDKPSATLLDGVSVTGEQDATEVTRAAFATYFVQVEGASGAELCTGEVSLELMSNFTFSIPKSDFTCGSASIDLSKVLGGFGKGGGSGETGAGGIANAISHDGKVLMLGELAGAKFDPPRPFLVGPIVQNASKFEGYDETFKSTVSGKDAEGQEYSGSGSLRVEVLATKTTYKNKFVDEFDSILHWKMTKKGFDGVPMLAGALLDHMELYMNTRPIMLPKAIVKADVAEAVTGAAGELLGVVTLVLTIKDYDLDGE